MQLFQYSYFRFCSALVFVGIALWLSILFHQALPESFLIFSLAAVMLSGWFGRTAAGLLAVVLSMVSVAYYFIPPYRAFAVELDELPYVFSFLSSALVTGWLGSARRNAEEKQKAHLDKLFEQTPEAIIMIDLQDRILRSNKQFTNIFGYTTREAMHNPSIDLIVPVGLRSEVAEARQHLSAGHSLSLETLRRRKDGSSVEVSEVSFPRLLPMASALRTTSSFATSRSPNEHWRNYRTPKPSWRTCHASRRWGNWRPRSRMKSINRSVCDQSERRRVPARPTAAQPGRAGEALECIVRDANRAADVIGRIRSVCVIGRHPRGAEPDEQRSLRALGLAYTVSGLDLACRNLDETGVEAAPPIRLRLLIRHANHVLSHHCLLREIWGNSKKCDAQYLRVYVGQLRRKLENDPSRPRYLCNEPGIGYRFQTG